MNRPPMSTEERRGAWRFLIVGVVVALVAVSATSGTLRTLVGTIFVLPLLLVGMNLFSRR